MTAESERAPNDIDLYERVHHAYRGRDAAGRNVLLIPLSTDVLPLGRFTGGVRLQFFPQVRYRWGKSHMESPTAILQCEDAGLGHTFGTLANDIAARLAPLGPTADPANVIDAFIEWQELLRERRRLTRAEEVGLWGELWMLSRLDRSGPALAAWRGPDSAKVDFVGGGIGVECKTSFREHVHLFSLEQVSDPLGDYPVYVVSIWVEHDEVKGSSLPELVRAFIDKAPDSDSFFKKLLRLGYAEADASLYSLRLCLLEEPKWFSMKHVPTVRVVDPGVSRVTFEAALTGLPTLEPAEGIQLLTWLTDK